MTQTSTRSDPHSDDHEHAVRRIEEFWASRSSEAASRILTGATLAFADLGYHGASTREIASRAGMSPAAMYIHFPSKEELFHHIALTAHVASTGSFNDPARQATDPSTRLRLGVASFATWMAEMNVFARTVEYEMRLHRGPAFADVWSLRRRLDEHMLEILSEGVEDGSFKIADLEWTKIMILSSCIDVGRWYRRDVRRTPTAIGFQYAELAMKLAGAR
jgi:AcrR family transcriptional regulator|nr:TetR family transcriptional regulator [Aeromicrobium sp.]